MKIFRLCFTLLSIFMGLSVVMEGQAQSENSRTQLYTPDDRVSPEVGALLAQTRSRGSQDSRSFDLAPPKKSIPPDQPPPRIIIPDYKRPSGCEWTTDSILGSPPTSSWCSCYDARRDRYYNGTPAQCGGEQYRPEIFPN